MTISFGKAYWKRQRKYFAKCSVSKVSRLHASLTIFLRVVMTSLFRVVRFHVWIFYYNTVLWKRENEGLIEKEN